MIDPNLVRGALELEPTDRGLLPHRLPAGARAQTDDPRSTSSRPSPPAYRLIGERFAALGVW